MAERVNKMKENDWKSNTSALADMLQQEGGDASIGWSKSLRHALSLDGAPASSFIVEAGLKCLKIPVSAKKLRLLFFDARAQESQQQQPPPNTCSYSRKCLTPGANGTVQCWFAGCSRRVHSGCCPKASHPACPVHENVPSPGTVLELPLLPGKFDVQSVLDELEDAGKLEAKNLDEHGLVEYHTVGKNHVRSEWETPRTANVSRLAVGKVQTQPDKTCGAPW
jgi:hypothetical protein